MYLENKKIYIYIQKEEKKKKNILTGEYPMKRSKTRGEGRLACGEGLKFFPGRGRT